MKSKLLIGSIIAVAILILVSFTSVVGYSSVRSTTGKESPLFNIRTNRAIGEESKILTSNYLVRGNTLPFPKRDDKAVMVQKVVDRIIMMDDKTYERFVTSLINNAQRDKRFNGISPDEIGEALYELRNSDEPIPILDAEVENKKHMGNIMYSVLTHCWTACCTIGHGWDGIRECIIWLPYFIALFIYGIASIISAILASIFISDFCL